MFESQEIERQLTEASEKLTGAANQIRKARKATENQDALVAQTAILREAVGLLVEGGQGLQSIIEELEERTRYLDEH